MIWMWENRFGPNRLRELIWTEMAGSRIKIRITCIIRTFPKGRTEIQNETTKNKIELCLWDERIKVIVFFCVCFVRLSASVKVRTIVAQKSRKREGMEWSFVSSPKHVHFVEWTLDRAVYDILLQWAQLFLKVCIWN